VSLGDRLLAMQRLRPRDAATRAAILALLELERPPEQPQASVGPWQANVEPAQPSVPVPVLDEPPPVSNEPTGSDLDPDGPRENGLAATVVPVGRLSVTPPEWSVPVAPFRPADGRAESVPASPLFSPRHGRAILGASLATLRSGPELDVRTAIGVMTQRRRLERIPYRPVLTVRAGAQVLIDVGPSMAPFRQDVEHLLVDVRRLFGGLASVIDFSRCPGRGVRAWQSDARRRPWRPPMGGGAVLVVSDFGIVATSGDVEAASLSEWEAFARTVAVSGCVGVALIPFTPERWPPPLTRLLRCLHWSERTTARQVARTAREHRGRPTGTT